MIEIKLPWPPTVLSPNSRAHWATVAKSKKRYRQACALYSISQMRGSAPQPLPADGELALALEFFPPSARKMDRDNLLARMKAGLDGVCDALAIDDARFEPVTVSMKKPLRAGMVRVVISNEGASQ